MVSNKMLLVLQPRQVSCSLNRYNLTVLCNLLKTVQFVSTLAFFQLLSLSQPQLYLLYLGKTSPASFSKIKALGNSHNLL